jgi:peptidoglycan hydrolase-like protein with peptidoglycan-binding domain
MKKIITEQLDNAARIVKLQADGYTFVSYRVYDNKLSDSCYCKVGNKFLSRKKKDSSEVCNCFDKEETNSTSNTSNSKYLGKYKGSDILPDFEIKEKNGKLIADNGAGDVELTLVSGNKFKGKVAGFDAEIVFTVSNDVSTGGNVTVAGKTISFTKVSSTPSKPDEPKTEDKSVWSCIENYNKEYNQPGLLDRDDYRYEKVDLQHNGKDTIFMYYKDYKAVWAYFDNKKPIIYGVWECKGNNGYLIKWSDGVISRYNTKEGAGRETAATTNTDTNTTMTLENPCVNGYKEGCVTENDILNKKKALKVCSKCDLVKKVQENPEIKARIFRIQKELGKQQKTDNLFGPIMLKAVKEFQSSNGINPTGNVGEKTLTMINSYSASEVNDPVVITKNKGEEPFINKTEVGGTNKAEVKPEIPPIYKKRTLRQVSFDEEL